MRQWRREQRDGEASVEQIRADLEQRGVESGFSRSVASRLAALSLDPSSPEYAAALDGAAVVHGAHRHAPFGGGEDAEQVLELKRLVEGFEGELRKLEEGLQILSAYVARMGVRTGRETIGPLH